jgi:hypothetical protein
MKFKNSIFFIPLAPFAFAIPSAQGGLDWFLKHVFSAKIIFFKLLPSKYSEAYQQCVLIHPYSEQIFLGLKDCQDLLNTLFIEGFLLQNLLPIKFVSSPLVGLSRRKNYLQNKIRLNSCC